MNTPWARASKKNRHSRTDDDRRDRPPAGRPGRCTGPRPRRTSLISTARMIGIGNPKTSARNANHAVFATAMPNSGSARTRGEVLEADQRRVGDEVRLLDAHHERPHDREPGEQPEDDEQRQQEDERAQAVAGEPEPAPREPARGRRSGSRRGGRSADRAHGSARRAAEAGIAATACQRGRGCRRRDGDAGPGDAGARTIEYGAQPLSRMAWTCGVRRVEQRVDVGVLVGEDGLHDGVEGRVEVLGVGGRLGDDRLVEDLRGERRHLGGRDVDVVLDPRPGTAS